jgi:RNA-directed DNA polymerase
MLRIRQVKHLAAALKTSPARLSEVAERPDFFSEELVLNDPAKPDKPRLVLCVRGALRALQERLYRSVLLGKVVPSVHSHGGVPGRHIKSNVEPHLSSSFVFTTDISDFYPSIHHARVYRLFVGPFQCSPDVARICTRLCTHNYHLALGLVTSPILADRLLTRVDSRIGGMCGKAGLAYTRYVDDITISGRFGLRHAGFARLVERILGDEGLRVNANKHQFGSLSGRVSVTGLRLVRDHLDVQLEYVRELERQLDDAARLARGGEFSGPFYLPSQIAGRVRFVCWVNPRRRRQLAHRWHSVPWDLVVAEARRRGLVARRKTLTRPDRDARCPSL